MTEAESAQPARNPERASQEGEEVIDRMSDKPIFTARLHGPGKITIPKNIRDLLDLREGDYVALVAISKLSKRGPGEASP